MIGPQEVFSQRRFQRKRGGPLKSLRVMRLIGLDEDFISHALSFSHSFLNLTLFSPSSI